MRCKSTRLTEVQKVKKALLVIDMQNVCVGEKHLVIRNLMSF